MAARARHVSVEQERIPQYAASLPLPSEDGETVADQEDPETLAAYWLTLDSINFGSGWFPTLRKRDGSSGYHTIARGMREHFATAGRWSAEQLSQITAGELATPLRQDSDHELFPLFARSLRDLGNHVQREYEGQFSAVLAAAAGSAVELAERLGSWECFRDSAQYEELSLPFLKRAQIAAADLSRAGFQFGDLERLTMFADNLVPHVLRLDGVLRFDSELAQRIEREELIMHGSQEEVEIRACGLHAVELIVAARPQTRAMDIDQLLWTRGQSARYKAVPRHRSRCTAY